MSAQPTLHETGPHARPAGAPPAVQPLAHDAVTEINAVVAAVQENQLRQLLEAVVQAKAVFWSGAGRSGLMSKAIAMRLMHMGIASYAVGEIATPAIVEGDLLVVVSARGSKSIVGQVQAARAAGASTISFSTSAATEVAQACDAAVIVPARTEVESSQHAGSLFEQSCLVLGDAVCRAAQSWLQVPTSTLNARHANLS